MPKAIFYGLSPAGSYKDQNLVFPLVGACLQANLCLPQCPITATIRQQAGSYKDQDLVFPLVGDKPASESLPEATPVDRHHSPAGWLLQKDKTWFFPMQETSLPANL